MASTSMQAVQNEKGQIPEGKELVNTGEEEDQPVREKLRDAAISSQRGSNSPTSSDAGMGQHTPPEEDSPDAKHAGPNGGSKPARKRSLEHLQEPDHGSNTDGPATPSLGLHARKKNKDQQENVAAQAAKRDQSPSAQKGNDETMAEGPSSPASGSEKAAELATMSPRRKRSAEELDPARARHSKVAATEETQKARKSLDEERPTIAEVDADKSNGLRPAPKQLSSLGGFGNASVSSPFASFGAKPSGSKAFGGASPFGAFGSNGGSTSTTTPVANTSTLSSAPVSSFANAISPFASTASGSESVFAGPSAFGGSKLSSFASKNGDFAAAPSIGAKFTSFASPSGGNFKPVSFGSGKIGAFASPNGGDMGSAKISRPFGAPANEKDKEDRSDADSEDDGDDAATETTDNENKDDDHAAKYQIHEEVETGEENEETLFSFRAKLYIFKDGWKERGVGSIKLNQTIDPAAGDGQEASEDDSEDLEAGLQNGNEATTEASNTEAANTQSRSQARLIMRSMATHRSVLNAALYRGMPIGDPQGLGRAPIGKNMVFLALEDGVMSKFLLKMSREDELVKLYELITDILERL